MADSKIECVEITNAAGDTLIVPWYQAMDALESVLDAVIIDPETDRSQSYSVCIVRCTQEKLDEADPDFRFE